MTRKKDKYAGLNAAQKGGDAFLVMTPAEWKSYFKTTNARTLRKIHGQLCQRPKSVEWDQIKKMFVDALQEKQQETLT
jgi:hypothetical protein